MAPGMRKMMNGKNFKPSMRPWMTWCVKFSMAAAVITVVVLFFDFDFGSNLGFKLLADRSLDYGVKVIPATLDDDSLAKLPPSTFSYLAMIDAGSSGCRAHVYRYGKLGSQDGALYLIPRHDSKKVKPGLSTFSDHPQDAGVSLKGLIDFIKTQVPEEDWSKTPIWLKATAGLRMLPVAKSDAVLNSVRGFLSSSKNSPFMFRPSWATVISGNEEGGFGWIAFNYLKRIIGPKKDPHAAAAPYAVIEMGGASSQVSQAALTKEERDSIPLPNKFQFDIEGEPFTLYTHSYLGFGGEQARNGLSKYLLQTKEESATSIGDPCLNKGWTRPGPSKDPYEGPTGVNVTGGSDGVKCLSAVSHIFSGRNPEECPSTSGIGKTTHITFQCTVQPTFIANSQNILVFENFFYMSSSLGVKSVEEGKTGVYPLKTNPFNIKEASIDFCEEDYATSMKQYPKDGQDKENNMKMCFLSSYAYSFLTNGLSINPSKTITIQKEVSDGVEIEWALGAAYKEASDFIKRSNLRPT